jgi:hypothetical protein
MSGKECVHLDVSKKDLLVKVCTCIWQYSTMKNPSSKFSPTKEQTHAFGVSFDIVLQCITKQYNNNGSKKHKQWSDAEQPLDMNNKWQSIHNKTSAN